MGTTWNLEGSVYSGTSNTMPIYQFGSLQIANRLAAYIVKHNSDDTITIVGKLKKNNWFRFDDGPSAPSTVASAAADLGYDIIYGWNETLYTIENAQIGNEQVALFSEVPFPFLLLFLLIPLLLHFRYCQNQICLTLSIEVQKVLVFCLHSILLSPPLS